ncbi:hypothetical protein DN069_27740 [Streptacidiphilus pinicola]|uniref:DUF3040 domain-containing protein n=1 Tax=Streptacidiphilus pinicola TaxID=2219663 RepID=A0A2X0J508_9ACTN|nr:DUF3040 domain-containing protein [Streptacidiphilus pinicola]RAG82458.1 hypothetical protein DN069_27740 [Streptacidiphilus pinicola]
MGLSMGDRRALDDIERRLTASDPRLAARLGTLSRSRHGAAAVRGALWRHSAAVACWLTVALAVAMFLLAAALHAGILAGVGVAILLTGAVTAWCRWAQRPSDTHAPRG